jgi:hypothetical protein
MKAYSKSGAVPPPILNLVLDDTSGQPRAPSALLRKMGPHHLLLWGWVVFRASLDVLEKRKLRALMSLPRFEPRIVQPVA